MKSNNSIKSIAFILWFVIFCPMRYYSSDDKNVISTIKKASADFTYRILPADVKQLYIIEVKDVEIKMETLVLKKVKSNKKQVRNILSVKITPVKK